MAEGRKKGGLLDVEKQFAFYGAYHSAPMNVLIHVLFVWPIFFTALLALAFTPPLFPLSSSSSSFSPLAFNGALLVALVYAGFYVRLDPRAGSLAALLCLLCWIASAFLAARLGPRRGLLVALASQIFCWTCQFIGHGVFEGRAPALLTNLAQAFLMAPFFVLLEVLMKFGYEPHPGFKTAVRAEIAAEIEAWRASKPKKSS
ncbi:2-hydroxy-palmitic acid dioxygenase MPO1-like [Wolffia australiana]